MRSKIIAFLLSFKKTWLHLIITLLFGVIILCIHFSTKLDSNIFNLLIGILSGLIASFILSHCDAYRINICAKNKIQSIIAIFHDVVTFSIKNDKYETIEPYKLYIELLTNRTELTYKSNILAISSAMASIIDDMTNNSDCSIIQNKLVLLQKQSENFYK